MTRTATVGVGSWPGWVGERPREEPSPLLLRILLLVSVVVLGLVQTNQASPGTALIAGQAFMVLLGVATVVLGFLGARWRIKFPPETLLSVAFVVWCLLGVFAAENLPLFYTRYGTLAKTVGMYVIFVNLVRTRKMLLWMAAGYVLTVSSYFLLGVEVRAEEGARAAGITGDPNGLAAFAVIAFACSMMCFHMVKRRWARVLFLLPLPVFAWMVRNSGSRSGMMGLLLLVGAVYWFYIRLRMGKGRLGRRLAGLMVGLLLLGGGLYLFITSPFWVRIQETLGIGNVLPRPHRGETRLYMALAGLKIMAEHPLLGVGYMQFAVVAGRFVPGLWMRQSHNTWVEAGAGAGLPGLFMWLGAYVLLTVRAYRLHKNARIPLGDRALAGLCLAFLVFWWFRSLFFIHLGEKVFLPVIGGITGYLTSLGRLHATGAQRGPEGTGGEMPSGLPPSRPSGPGPS